MSRVIVVDYDPAWPGIFEELRARLWDALSDVACAIEHVGSTAVPGLPAKPVIDMDVVVPRHRVGEGIRLLGGLGYGHRGDLGIPEREAFRPPVDSPPHHLYLCPEGSRALANHLAIRNDLRSNPAEAQAYGELKKRLAGQYSDDMDGYIEGKTGFLLDILGRSGFGRRDLDDIARGNRRSRGT